MKHLTLIAALLLVGCKEQAKPVYREIDYVPEVATEEFGKYVVHCMQHTSKSFSGSLDDFLASCEKSGRGVFSDTKMGFQWVDSDGSYIGPVIPCTEAIKFQEVEACGVQNVYRAE
jgi:hypothetical protein